MVRDTPSSQDASTHQIWNSYLKEYRRYAPDTKRDGRTDGRTDSAITICLPKFLWGHKKIKCLKTYECFQIYTEAERGTENVHKLDFFIFFFFFFFWGGEGGGWVGGLGWQQNFSKGGGG